ncbi:hypothetical protein PF327_05225 [Sulfurovum sp. XTW-4]|uniref:MFS transporter n=1 Tax=Sulfurovum xiamenensis TaxID=3019066 RepID=A0ABT7QRS3_9BACT|nr:hypothetical protein [Sulfurovum xiamenensis]MDM5263594.1 hypothetical protein [Sulfurovum xiamenensis]
MKLRNYKFILYEINQSTFLYLQSLAILLITYIDWTLMPYVTKLEGTYLPVYMISFFMLIGALDGIIQPLFKHIRIYKIYLFSIVLDVIQIASYSLYLVSIEVFTYVILAIFTIQGITFEVARVHTVDFMKDESIDLKEYLMIRSFIISLAIILGGVSAMLFDSLDVPLLYILSYLTLLALYGIYLQYKLYQIFKKRIFLSDIELEQDKKELFEKFR